MIGKSIIPLDVKIFLALYSGRAVVKQTGYLQEKNSKCGVGIFQEMKNLNRMSFKEDGQHP